MIRRIAHLVVPLLVLIAAAGCGSDGHRTRASYVALGDSYTAGPGIEPVAEPRCGRSRINYPSLVAKALEVGSFDDRSCGGATTDDFQRAQAFGDESVNDPQMDAVGKDTTLVTVGIGLNNSALSIALLGVCATPPGTEMTDACKQYLKQPESETETQIHAVAAQVGASLETIAEKAPEARIVLVGYPRIVPDKGSCPDRFPFPEAQVSRLREAMGTINQTWRMAAEAAGASYVDMYTPSEGHDVCSDDPWISDYRGVPGQAAALHPFASYEKAVADRIVELVEKD